jgi:hypothetical protein
MGLRGHVASMALEEVLGFLGANALDGTLTVTCGEEASLRLYFHEGRIFFPFSGRKGTYSLGKLLRHTGALSREALETYLAAARREKAALLQAEAEGPQVEEARRRQTTEEIHDLFLWGNARFEFAPGPMPPRVHQDYTAARGLILDIQGLLMEVAHRADERRRIRAVLPSSRVVLRQNQGLEADVVAGLAAERIDVTASPFDGETRVDDLLARWGVPHHDALRAIGLLLEHQKVKLLPVAEARAKAALRIAQGDLAGAGRLLGHVYDVAPTQPGPPLELDLVASAAFTSGPETAVSLRLPGRRAFALAQALLERSSQFTMVLRASMHEVKLSALPGEVAVRGSNVELEDVLLHLQKLDPKGLAAAKAANPGLPVDLTPLVAPLALEEGRRELVVHTLVASALLGPIDVELRNRHQPAAADAHVVALPPDARAKLVASLGQWAKVLDRVPGDDAIFISGRKAGETNDPAVRFFSRFTLRRNLGEARREARAKPLEFMVFVARGLDRGYLRAPTVDELGPMIVKAREQGNDIQVSRLVRAGLALGLGDGLQKAVGQVAATVQADAPQPAIEGDLEGIGLAAVLQALRDNRRTGTLQIKAGKREEKLYFHRGDAFILRFQDAEAEAFAEFFLGEEGAAEVSALAETHGGAGGRIDESAIDQHELREIKSQFLDILFWEGATFAFFQNELPDDFFEPGENVSEIALETDRFLLDAIRALTEWDQIRRVVPTGRAVFRFAEPERKLAILRERSDDAALLTLIDGRQAFDDMVRVSGVRRLVAGRLIKGLVEEGVLLPVDGTGAAGAPGTHKFEDPFEDLGN